MRNSSLAACDRDLHDLHRDLDRVLNRDLNGVQRFLLQTVYSDRKISEND